MTANELKLHEANQPSPKQIIGNVSISASVAGLNWKGPKGRKLNEGEVTDKKAKKTRGGKKLLEVQEFVTVGTNPLQPTHSINDLLFTAQKVMTGITAGSIVLPFATDTPTHSELLENIPGDSSAIQSAGKICANSHCGARNRSRRIECFRCGCGL